MSEAGISRRGLFKLAGLGAAAAGLESLVGCGHSQFYKGERLFEEKKFNESIEELTKYIREHPENEVAHILRGSAHAMNGSIGSAERDLNRAIDVLGADLEEAYRMRGYVRFQRGKACQALMGLNPDLADKAMEYFDGAVEDLKIAVKKNPNVALSQAYLGFAYEKIHEPLEAYHALEKSVKLLDKMPKEKRHWEYKTRILHKALKEYVERVQPKTRSDKA